MELYSQWSYLVSSSYGYNHYAALCRFCNSCSITKYEHLMYVRVYKQNSYICIEMDVKKQELLIQTQKYNHPGQPLNKVSIPQLTKNDKRVNTKKWRKAKTIIKFSKTKNKPNICASKKNTEIHKMSITKIKM